MVEWAYLGSLLSEIAESETCATWLRRAELAQQEHANAPAEAQTMMNILETNADAQAYKTDGSRKESLSKKRKCAESGLPDQTARTTLVVAIAQLAVATIALIDQLSD